MDEKKFSKNFLLLDHSLRRWGRWAHQATQLLALPFQRTRGAKGFDSGLVMVVVCSLLCTVHPSPLHHFLLPLLPFPSFLFLDSFLIISFPLLLFILLVLAGWLTWPVTVGTRLGLTDGG